MIQIQTQINVSDNTGARSILCIRIVSNKNKYASSGDIIVGAIKKALPVNAFKKKLPPKPGKKTFTRIIAKKSEIALAVIIRVKSFLSRSNGIFVAFDDNACALITSDKNPRGTKIFGAVSREVRNKKFIKLTSLASEVL